MTFEEYYKNIDADNVCAKWWKEELNKAFDAGYSAGLQDAAKNITDAINAYNFRDSTKLDLVNSVAKTPAKPEVIYPQDGEFYSVEVTFNRPLQREERDQVEKIAEYWGALPFCGEFLGTTWLDYNRVSISQDITKSTSDDWGMRNVLELLLEYIQDGTHVRKTNKAGKNTRGTRAVDGLGPVVSKIEGK